MGPAAFTSLEAKVLTTAGRNTFLTESSTRNDVHRQVSEELIQLVDNDDVEAHRAYTFIYIVEEDADRKFWSKE